MLPIDGDGHLDEDGHLTVPEALDLIEQRVGKEKMFTDDGPLATPLHVVHTAKLCAANEPEVPGGPAPAPYPPPADKLIRSGCCWSMSVWRSAASRCSSVPPI